MRKESRIQMTETKWTKKVCSHLTAGFCMSPVVVTVLSAGVRSQHGIPDRHFNSKVWRGFVEFKGRDTEVTRPQKRFIYYQNVAYPGSAFVWRQCSGGTRGTGGAGNDSSVLDAIVEDCDGVEITRGHCCACLVVMGFRLGTGAGD